MSAGNPSPKCERCGLAVEQRRSPYSDPRCWYEVSPAEGREMWAHLGEGDNHLHFVD